MTVELFDDPSPTGDRPDMAGSASPRPRQEPIRNVAQLHARLAALLARLGQESRSIEAAQSELLGALTAPLSAKAARDLQHLDAMTQVLDDLALVCDALAADPALSEQIHGAAPLRAARLERTAAALFGAE